MNGRLIVKIDEMGFYFSTLCDMEVQTDKLNLSFMVLHADATDAYAVGISPQKIFFLKNTSHDDGEEWDTDEQLLVLRSDGSASRIAVYEAEGYSVMFMPSEMEIRMHPHGARGKLPCRIRSYDQQGASYILHFECFLAE